MLTAGHRILIAGQGRSNAPSRVFATTSKSLQNILVLSQRVDELFPARSSFPHIADGYLNWFLVNAVIMHTSSSRAHAPLRQWWFYRHKVAIFPKRTMNSAGHCWQGVEHFKDIQYNERSKYGEILLQQEYEMSCFNLEEANIDIYQQLYALYEKVGTRDHRAYPSMANFHSVASSHLESLVLEGCLLFGGKGCREGPEKASCICDQSTYN